MRTSVKYTELLNASNRKNLNSCLIQGKSNFVFDDSCKSYIVELNSGSMTLPRISKDALKLVRPYLLFQIFFYANKQFTIEFVTSDSEGINRRIIITQCKNLIKNLMHARVPNTKIEKNVWLHLYFDVASLFSQCFPLLTLRSIDSIYITATCKLRRIYSVTEPDIDYILPSGFELSKIIKLKTQIFSFDNFEKNNENSYNNTEPKKMKMNNNNSISLPKILHSKNSSVLVENSNNKIKHKSVRNSIDIIKKEYIEGISLGAKKYFRKKFNEKLAIPDKNELWREKMRKITHNHYSNPAQTDIIEENIVVESSPRENSLLEILKSRGSVGYDCFDIPNFFENTLKLFLQVRHVTPPFVNLQDGVRYDPVHRSYEQLLS